MERLVEHSVYLIQMLVLFYFIEPHSINNYDRVDASACRTFDMETGTVGKHRKFKYQNNLPLGKKKQPTLEY